MMKAAAVNIRLSWGTLEGLHWSRPGAPKVLCLHGWLDNAASFVPLAPYLEDFDLLALDFAGHGLSAHRPAGSRYYLVENLYDVDAALGVLGWDNCHMIGHSMGGGVASSFAAARPACVERLVLLDAVGTLSQSADQTARQLGLSMQSVRKTRSVLRPYESVEEAMQARQKTSSLSDGAARILCERSLQHTGDYYQWRTDPRLNWRSPQLPTDEQALDLLAAIKAPTLAITSATAFEYLGDEMLQKRLAAIADCTHVNDAGNHHFHMEQPEHIGICISEFLQRQDQNHDHS